MKQYDISSVGQKIRWISDDTRLEVRDILDIKLFLYVAETIEQANLERIRVFIQIANVNNFMFLKD